MRGYQEFQQKIKVLFTDIDDTLTTHGQLGPRAYEMLWKLADQGIAIVPITGRPAGWCEMIARFWPAHSVIGENGAFYFSYQNKKMKRHFCIDDHQRKENRKKLSAIEKEVLEKIPQAAIASDQFTRLFDLAIDFCEDIPALDKADVERIVEIFHQHGAVAKVSSIHVNGWFGNYDKKSMCETFYKNEFKRDLSQDLNECAFVGDSPNDEPMFGYFDNSFAVANISQFVDQLKEPPKYLIPEEGGDGFELLGTHLLNQL